MLYAGPRGLVAHECILDLRPLKETSDVAVDDVAKRLMDYGFHAPTMSFPVPGTLMVEPTESESKAELDRFVAAMIAIRGEIRAVEEGRADRADNPLKHAPHTAAAVTADAWPHAYRREVAAYPLAALRASKYWPPVARVDNVYGDRNLFCSCVPVTDYAAETTAAGDAARRARERLTMRVVVLGAGVVGVTAAWYLAADGHEVTVVDRQPGAGLETSFANGGQISASHAEPWANPDAPRTILKWLGREDAPLLFRLRADPRQWLWGLSFLRECLPHRTRRNTIQCLNLALYSRDCLRALCAATGHRVRPQHARDPADLHRGERIRSRGRRCGDDARLRHRACDRLGRPMRRDRARARALPRPPGRGHLHGVRRVRRRAPVHAGAGGARGGPGRRIPLWRHGRRAAARGRRAHGRALSRWRRARRDACRRRLRAWHSGATARCCCARFGVSLHRSIRSRATRRRSTSARIAARPTVSLTDIAAKIVMTRLGDRLRVAGTAELSGYGTDLNSVRCEALAQRTFELFPDAGERGSIAYWAGLRPATPSNVPCVGAHALSQPVPRHGTRHAGLHDGLRVGARARRRRRRTHARTSRSISRDPEAGRCVPVKIRPSSLVTEPLSR